MGNESKKLQNTYSLRFSKLEKYRTKVWEILCKDFFSRYISPHDVVLDMGSGWGEFINNVKASHKYAMDLNPDASHRLNNGIQFLQQDCSHEWNVPQNSLDVVFSSNFLEHLPGKTHVESALAETHRCLKEGGFVIFLGPNIKYLNGSYWDFWDHFVPLTEQSLTEILRLKGFEVQVNLPRFLPYSMSTGHTPPLIFLKMYLRIPLAWRLFGKQFLVIGKKLPTSKSESGKEQG